MQHPRLGNGHGDTGGRLWGPWRQHLDSPTCTTNLRINDDDSGKFTYISPRFAGFQAGISYIPTLESGGDNNSALTKIGTGDNGRNSGLKNGVAGGLNYTETFGDVGVQASGGAMWAKSFSGGANGNNSNLIAYNAGLQLELRRLQLRRRLDPRPAGPTRRRDGSAVGYHRRGRRQPDPLQRHELDGRCGRSARTRSA